VIPAAFAHVLHRLGLGGLSTVEPGSPVVRYQRQRPGELIHIEVKKLGRVDGVGHLIAGDRCHRPGLSQPPPAAGLRQPSGCTTSAPDPIRRVPMARPNRFVQTSMREWAYTTPTPPRNCARTP
jgi:hypothetical protein